MPIYEYKCASCGHIAEILVMNSADDTPPAVCPNCRNPQPLSKIYSAFATVSPSGGELPQMGCACGEGGCGSGACCLDESN